MKNRATLAVIIVLAGAGAGFATLVSARSVRTAEPTLASLEPTAPGVYGVAVVEPLDEATRIAPPAAGLVAAVKVAVGRRVAAGDLLVALDDAEARARLAAAEATAAASTAAVGMRRADLAVAQARRARVAAPARSEEVAPAVAAERAARAEAAEARDRLARCQMLARELVSAAELEERKRAADAAEARAAQAAAEAARVSAPGWERDVAIADAEVEAATTAVATAEATAAADRAAVEVARVALEQRSVRAPRAGRVLRLDVHAGEWVAPNGPALLELADDTHLRLTAEVDALDAWRVGEGDAVAWRRGDPSHLFTARFLLVEPLARAKRDGSGATDELVDTRVRRILYALDGADGLLPGEQLEVRLGVRPAPEPPTAMR